MTSRLATESAGSVALTYSVDSLDPLWAWAAPRFWWRGDINRLRQGTPGPDISSEQLEPVAGLPSWSNHPSGAGYAELSSESLWLVDGLGRYLGETPVS